MGIRHPHKPSEYPNLLLFILDKTHFTITFATASVLLYTRSPHVAWFAIGAVAAMQFAKLIKLFIREARPEAPPAPRPGQSKPPPRRPKKTFGMPSTHATALSFYHGYLLPLVPSLVVYLFPRSYRSWSGILSFDQARFLMSLGLSTAWALGLWSRVELGYHTYPQIAVGAALGEIMGMGWRMLWTREQQWAEPLLREWIEWGWALTLGKVF